MPPKKKIDISIKEAIDIALGYNNVELSDTTWKTLFMTHYSQYLNGHPKSKELAHIPEGMEDIDWESNFKKMCIYEKKIMGAVTLVLPELKKQDTLEEFKTQRGMSSDLDWNQIISLQEDAIYEFREYLNWSAVSKRTFKEDFIPYIANFLDWKVVSQSYTPDHIIYSYPEKLDWKYLSERGLSQDIIRKYPNRVHWKRLPPLNYSEDFMIEFYDKLRHVEYAPLNDKFFKKVKNVNWGTIKTNNLSNKIIIKNKKNINWALNREDLSKRKWDDVEFIEEFADHFIWKELPVSHLTPTFINKHKDQINWDDLSCEIRSERFINIFKDYINWQNLPNKKYSDEFILEHKNKIYWPNALVEHLKEETLVECAKCKDFPWDKVSRINLSEQFMEKYQKKLNWKTIARNKHLSKSFRKKFSQQIDPHIKDHIKAVTNVEEEYTRNLNDPENQKLMQNFN